MYNVFIDRIIFVILIFFYSLTIIKSQTNLYSGLEIVYLPYNSLTGVKMTAGVEKQIEKSFFYLNSHLIYAIGNRDFDLNSNETYTLVDGSNRSDYPLPGIIPGFEESSYILPLKLTTAKTIDLGFALLYGKPILNIGDSKLIACLGLNFSWVEEVSILHNLKGNFTNILGTVEDVHLVTPYSQNYFTLGPQLGLIYNFNLNKNTSFGLKLNITWLANTGINYSLGPSFRINLN